MKLWQNKPNMYTRIGFIDIPEGDHRAKVCRVEAQKASKGRVCYEITLQVSGYHGKLWYRLWYEPDIQWSRKSDMDRYMFFYSFGIKDGDMFRYKEWVGAEGLIRVKHRWCADGFEAQCMIPWRPQGAELPSWKDAPDGLPLCFSHNDIF